MGGWVVWYKVIIVSAISLSLSLLEIKKEKERDRAWQFNFGIIPVFVYKKYVDRLPTGGTTELLEGIPYDYSKVNTFNEVSKFYIVKWREVPKLYSPGSLATAMG